MSQLGRAVRDLILATPGSGVIVPGGIYPEVAPATVSLPFMVYTGSSSDRVMDLTGEALYTTETVDLVVTADSRSECEDAVAFLAGLLGPGSWTAAQRPRFFWWRFETHGDVSEVLVDGSDDMVRQVRMTVTGAYSAGGS